MGWLVGWLVDWWIGWLVGRIFGWWVCWWVGGLDGWLVGGSTGCRSVTIVVSHVFGTSLGQSFA